MRAFLMVKQGVVLPTTLQHFGRLESWAACQKMCLIPMQNQPDALWFIVFNSIGTKARCRTDGQQWVIVVEKFARVFVEAEVQIMEGDGAWNVQFEVQGTLLN